MALCSRISQGEAQGPCGVRRNQPPVGCREDKHLPLSAVAPDGLRWPLKTHPLFYNVAINICQTETSLAAGYQVSEFLLARGRSGLEHSSRGTRDQGEGSSPEEPEKGASVKAVLELDLERAAGTLQMEKGTLGRVA